VLAAFFVVSYYMSMVGMCIHYFIASMALELPWAKCQYDYPSNCVNSDLRLRQSKVGSNVSSSEVYYL
jgi:Sodium:neurotransmitter symporter family